MEKGYQKYVKAKAKADNAKGKKKKGKKGKKDNPFLTKAASMTISTPVGKYRVEFDRMRQVHPKTDAARPVRRSTPEGRKKAAGARVSLPPPSGGARRSRHVPRIDPHNFIGAAKKAYWQWEDPPGSGSYTTYPAKTYRTIERAYNRFLNPYSSGSSSDSNSSNAPAGSVSFTVGSGKSKASYSIDFASFTQINDADTSKIRSVRRLKGTPKSNPPPPPPPKTRRRAASNSDSLSAGIRVRAMPMPDPPKFYSGVKASHWAWEDPVGTNTFVPYSVKQTTLIETGYQKYTAGQKAAKRTGGKPKKVKVVIKAGSNRYAISFHSLTQSLTSDPGKKRAIVRLQGPHPDLVDSNPYGTYSGSGGSGSGRGSGSYSYSGTY